MYTNHSSGLTVAKKRHVRAWRAVVRAPLEMEKHRTMRQLQSNRLKTSRVDTADENSSQTTRKPRVVGTSDGINVDLPATPSYDREYDSLIEEAVRDQ